MENKTPLLSVIVPVYNVAPYLPECLDSIVGQSYSNLEIILVDDGSKDESGLICDSYALKDNRIIVVHKENGGLVSARKAGIKRATGAYVTYVDSDDKIDINMFEFLMNKVIQDDLDVAISGFYIWTENKIRVQKHGINPGVYISPEQVTQLMGSTICKKDYFSFGILPSLWGKLFKKELLLSHQLDVSDGIKLGEDAACTYPCLLSSKRIGYFDNPLYYYRQRPNSMTHVKPLDEIMDILELMKHMQIKFQGDCIIDRQRQLYFCYLLDDYISGAVKRGVRYSQLHKYIEQIKKSGLLVEVNNINSLERTSSRCKRVINLLNNTNHLSFWKLKSFIFYEKVKG